MRPADFIILGVVMMLGGEIALKLEIVLGELKSSKHVNSVPNAAAATLVAIAGLALNLLGLVRLVY